ncbi:isoprenylcysteine carboxylmethyltransferase family protein [Seongchinamella unica]|uniref:Isoprenylcysteine carboxylmethyltransferase family protein n=1 Tax=Seongchinamella unica TaxID=2547392 RepID=A0A4R5LQA6_9GAMM|nr:methyltransferase [Seongchinamella unica]TDG12596.1 isoprenylcysteine carboxylmethyltransferase family protein [Seongchinamella unica]
MKKLCILLFGIFSYLVGLLGLTAFMLYMGGWSFLPMHVNSAVANGATAQAIVINLLIMALFGLHHSIAARSSFKEKLTRFMPVEMERSAYVLVSGIFMFAICLYWQPLPGSVWSVNNTIAVVVLKSIHVLGWLVLVGATFEIDHFHLMGLKQSITMNPSEGDRLKENFLYRMVRHPIQTGVLLGIWSTDYMSMTQFMLSTCLTLYIFIGLHYEEKSLISHFGDVYLDYKKRVPAVIPFWPVR